MDYYPPGPFQPGPIRPLVRPGENVLLQGLSPQFQLFRVRQLEPLFISHALVVDINLVAGVIAPLAANTSGVQYDTTPILKMSLGQIAQVRMAVLDDINVSIRQLGVPTNQTQQIVTDLNAFGALEDPCGHLSEKFVWETYVPFLTPINPTQYQTARTRVKFWGFRYVMEGATGEVDGHLKPLAVFANMEDAQNAKVGEIFPRTNRGDSTKIKFMVIPLGGFA